MWATGSHQASNVIDRDSGVQSMLMERNSESRKRVWRFLIAGAANTVFGFAVYSVFILSGVAAWFALMGGMVIGTLFNFMTMGKYVFEDPTYARAPRFLICYAIVYGINLQALEWLSTVLVDEILSQAILALPMAVIAFSLMKTFVFIGRTA